MGKKTSINNIAKELGISPTTVSFVLNGRAEEKRISDKLVKIVLSYVEEIGYKPNSIARSLRTGKTNTIGLIVEDISDVFFSTIAKHIEEKAYENGYRIIYSSTEDNPEKAKELIDMYRDRHVDGYIIIPPDGIDKEIKDLIASGKPVVVLDRYIEDASIDYITVNNQESVYEAVKKLIESGRKNIAFVTLNSLQSQMMGRLAGYEQALEEHSLPQYIKEVSYENVDTSIKHIVSLLQRKPEIDAVFFATNYLGVSGLKAIRELNLKIPEQLSVVCFDDYELFEMYTPSISCIAQPIEELAENAINILLARLRKGGMEKKAQKIMLPTKFIQRESSL